MYKVFIVNLADKKKKKKKKKPLFSEKNKIKGRSTGNSNNICKILYSTMKYCKYSIAQLW